MGKIIDLHTHSTFSDGTLTVEEVIKTANGNGYEVGICDHLSKYHKIKTDSDLERYIFYLEKLDCYKAGEIDLGEETIFSNKLLQKLDYIIGGVHNLFWEGRWQCIFVMKDKINEIEKFMKLYKETILKAIKNPVIRFDILAHPTKLPPYLANNFKEEEIITDEWIDEIFYEAKQKNIAVEINNTERVLSERCVKKALKMGLKLSIGSDCHNRETCNLNWCIEVIKNVGIPESAFYKPKGRM